MILSNWHMSKQGSTAMPCSSRCHHYGDNRLMVVGLLIEIWSWTGSHLVTQQRCQTGWDSSTLIPALQVSDKTVNIFTWKCVCATCSKAPYIHNLRKRQWWPIAYNFDIRHMTTGSQGLCCLNDSRTPLIQTLVIWSAWPFRQICPEIPQN